MIIVVTGPPGCGKTRSTATLRRMLNVKGPTIDGWAPHDTRPIPDNALVLTCEDARTIQRRLPGAKVYSFDILISGFARRGGGAGAKISIPEQMREAQLSGLEAAPDPPRGMALFHRMLGATRRDGQP